MRPARLAVAACLLSTGCAPALREPKPMQEIVGTGAAHSPTEVDSLLARAEAQHALRDVRSTRNATEIWLAAAAADPDRIEGILGATRARVWLAEHEESSEARLRAAISAVETVQWCGKIAPAEAACAYWLGVALGVQARERPATGLSALPRMIEAFEKAARQAPLLDDAGPDRALALLFVRAPGWPSGPGDADTGLLHAKRAVELRPNYPPNLLALAEALGSTGDPGEAEASCRRALQLARARAACEDPDAAEWVAEAETALEKGF